MIKRIRTVLAVALFAMLLVSCSNQDQNAQDLDDSNAGINTENGGNQMSEANGQNRHVLIKTNMGDMKLELYEQRAPKTTKNFIDLVQQGYYDQVKFHRVIKDFMIQGGDPLTKDDTKQQLWGTGGPGYTIDDEFHPELKHDKAGVLSMANAGPDSGGSQFFITLAPTPWLDGKHAVFGEIVEGQEVLEKIGASSTGSRDIPKDDIVMEKVTIV